MSGERCDRCGDPMLGHARAMGRPFHWKSDATRAAYMARQAAERVARTADLRARLAAKAADDPEGDAGIWADMLREHDAANGGAA